VKLFSLKMKDMSWAGNKTRYIFVILSFGLLFTIELHGRSYNYDFVCNSFTHVKKII